MTHVAEYIHKLVWGVPALAAILGVGLWLSVRTRFAQLRLFPAAIVRFFRQLRTKDSGDGVSPMQALCTALAATVGTGNIAGVAGAIAIGGPGAIFWMWLCAVLAMATKYAETVLAMRYRIRQGGEYLGGTMYIIDRACGRKWRPLALMYAFFGVVASFGVGNAAQINAVITGVDCVLSRAGDESSFAVHLAIGAVLALLIGAALFGGARRIGKTASVLVPFAALGYLAMGIAVLILRFDRIPAAFSAIFTGAFSPEAATGGVIGSVWIALRTGVSRGVFTNEAGMGTAAMAHAGASADHPVQQGLLGIVEVFADTVVICSVTALVILVSGVSVPYGLDTGAALTSDAFCAVLGDWAGVAVAAALCCFAVATVLGWGLYGTRCAQFLFGVTAKRPFALLQAGFVLLGALMNTATVWLLADTVNALMAIPNLIVLVMLSPELLRLTKEYELNPGLNQDRRRYL